HRHGPRPRTRGPAWPATGRRPTTPPPRTGRRAAHPDRDTAHALRTDHHRRTRRATTPPRRPPAPWRPPAGTAYGGEGCRPAGQAPACPAAGSIVCVTTRASQKAPFRARVTGRSGPHPPPVVAATGGSSSPATRTGVRPRHRGGGARVGRGPPPFGSASSAWAAGVRAPSAPRPRSMAGRHSTGDPPSRVFAADAG